MATATTNWSFPRPAGSDQANTADDTITALADALDNVTKLTAGTFAARPATAKAGQMYFATDTATMYVYVNAAWFELAPGAGSVPVGGMLAYAGSTDPADTRYVLADGRALSRTTYAALFAALGTAFGAGDGSTTFNVPDTRSKTLVGSGQGAGLTNRARAATGGEELHALSVPELATHGHGVSDPTHAHTIYDPSHSHSLTAAGNHNHAGVTGGMDRANPHSHTQYFRANGGSATVHTSGAYDNNSQLNAADQTSASDINHAHSITTDGNHSHTVNAAGTGIGIYGAATGVTVNNNGSGTAHNNMQPFLVVPQIIRVS